MPRTIVLFILTNTFNPHHNPMRQVLQIKLNIYITMGKQKTKTCCIAQELYPISVITYIGKESGNNLKMESLF